MARQGIELQPEEEAELQRRLRAGTVSVRDRRRSEIILLSAEGLTQQQIADRMGYRGCGWAAGSGVLRRTGWPD
jgi:DNA-directed RNA polymerase specialized sigma24 family protein